MMPDHVRKWLNNSQRLLCCGFWSTGKAVGQYRSLWRMYREINVSFEVRILYILRVIFICDLFTDSPLYNNALYFPLSKKVFALLAETFGIYVFEIFAQEWA
jgi:hypothetical protein